MNRWLSDISVNLKLSLGFGLVRYELLTAPKAVSHCHCGQCRKGHGAAFASYASVARSALLVLQGADKITAYPSSATVVREFCGHGIGKVFHEEPQILHYGRAGGRLSWALEAPYYLKEHVTNRVLPVRELVLSQQHKTTGIGVEAAVQVQAIIGSEGNVASIAGHVDAALPRYVNRA